MNKVPFSSLNVSINESDCLCSYCDGEDDISYQVKRYLPFVDKVALIEKVINQSLDDNGFYNPLKVNFYLTLEIMFAYTNLEFSEEELNDLPHLYDLVVSTGIYADVIASTGENEYLELNLGIQATIDNIYKYRNSARGILEDIRADYSSLEYNAEKIREDLGNPENLEFLREVMEKLG